MPAIKVYPTHEAALDVRHPVSGPLSDEGSLWEHDAFTARLLSDNAVTTDAKRGHKSERSKIDHSKPPAHATGAQPDDAPAAAAPPATDPDDHVDPA